MYRKAWVGGSKAARDLRFPSRIVDDQIRANSTISGANSVSRARARSSGRHCIQAIQL